MKALRRNRVASQEQLVARIAAVLDELAPLLRIEHCTLQVADFVPATGVLTVRFAGTCPDCAASPAMFLAAIEAHVRRRVPEVLGLRSADFDQ